MIQRARRAAAVCLLALTLTIVGCRGDAPPPLTPSAQEAARVLPSDARLITRLDLNNLQQQTGLALSSERGVTLRFLDSDITFNPLSTKAQHRLQAFIDATGFDPASDLESIYVAMPSDSAEARGAGFAIRVDMNRSQLEDYLASQDSLVAHDASYRNTAIYRLRRGPDPLQFALLSDRLIVAASNDGALRTMIDRYDGQAPTLANSSEQRQRLFAESVREGPLGLVAYDLPTQRLLQQTDADSDLERIGQAVRDIVGTLDFTEDQVRGRLLLTTDRNASDVASVVRGAIAALKTDPDRSDAQRAMLDRVKVTDGDGTVTIQFDMKMEMLARMLLDLQPTRT